MANRKSTTPEVTKLPPSNKKFDILDEDWKDKFASAGTEDLNLEIAKVAKDQEALEKTQDEDQDLASAKEQAKEAGAVYRDGKKANRAKIQWLVQVLGDRGAE
jgi:hypothetical protein